MAQLLSLEQLRLTWRLKFPQPDEAEFWLDWAEKIRRPARIICVAGFVLALFYLAATFFLLGAELRGANLRSVAAIVPVLGITYLLAGSGQGWVRINPMLLWLAILSMVATNGNSILAGTQPVYERAIITNWMFFSVIVIGSGLALVRSAVVSILILLGSYYILSVGVRPLTEPARTMNWMILVQTSFFAIAAAYVAEVRARREFLLGKMLEVERQKTERLLVNVLPSEIADRLKGNPHTLAQRHEDASVMFADIVGFTPFAAALEPDVLVDFLDNIFTVFDDLVEKRGLEKIKTIGDAYMVAGGVLSEAACNLESMAELAIELIAAANKAGVELRIGIHCGPLVAGVIGRRKYLYDLWGETVNTASRMESHGLPDRIQVSAEVAERLRERFHLEDRGLVDVKGMGRIPTWFLLGSKETTPGLGGPEELVVASLSEVRGDRQTEASGG